MEKLTSAMPANAEGESLSDKCRTGIPGLDEVLGGGFPRNRIFLLQGESGVGKTTLAMQYLLEGARHGETGLYITLSETEEELKAVARSHGWNLDSIAIVEFSGIQQRIASREENTLFHPSEIELNETTKILFDEVERVRPARLVLDSLSELRLLAQSPLRYRREILEMKQFFSGRHCTTVLVDDKKGQSSDLDVQSIAHGVLTMEQEIPMFGSERRRLSVTKIRGVIYRGGYHDYVIQRGGLEVFPRLVASQSAQSVNSGQIFSGVPELDQLLKGGIQKGTSTLIMGPAGSGKSTIALQYAVESARRREKVLFYEFEENLATLRARAVSLKMGLEEAIEQGNVHLQQVDPAEFSSGQLIHMAQRAVEEHGVEMVIIDSLNGYIKSMPEDRYLILQLHELMSFLGHRGVVSFLILSQHGFLTEATRSEEITYLADSVLVLRYFEAAGTVRQAISVMKKRSGDHERTIREFQITSAGIRVGPPLTEFHGVLSGIPTFSGKIDHMLSSDDRKR